MYPTLGPTESPQPGTSFNHPGLHLLTAEDTVGLAQMGFDHSIPLPCERPTVPYGDLFRMEDLNPLPKTMFVDDFEVIQRAGDASQRKHHRARARAAIETPRTEVYPTPLKTPKLREGSSASTAPTARSSYETTNSAWTPVTSWNSGLSVSSLSPEGQSPPPPKEYMCPMCSAGPGHFRRINNKRKANESGKNGPSLPCSRAQHAEYVHWDEATAFDAHMMELHHTHLKRTNSSEYICLWCMCSCVSREPSATCPARFATLEDIVDHVREGHARLGQRELPVFHHRCAPISDESYTFIQDE